MSEEVVYNVDAGAQSCVIFCNWCTETFTYEEREGQRADNTCCPWCRHKLKIPRNKMRRLNGVRR